MQWLRMFATEKFMQSISCRVIGDINKVRQDTNIQMQGNVNLQLSEYIRIQQYLFTIWLSLVLMIQNLLNQCIVV